MNPPCRGLPIMYYKKENIKGSIKKIYYRFKTRKIFEKIVNIHTKYIYIYIRYCISLSESTMIFRKLMYKKMMQQFYGFFGGAGLAKEKSSSFLVSSSWRGTSTSVTSSSSSSSTLTIKLVVAVVGDNASASKSDPS